MSTGTIKIKMNQKTNQTTPMNTNSQFSKYNYWVFVY